jgi:glutamate synthase domain-containing protein 2
MNCQTGKCAFGIGTQDPELRQNLDVDEAAERVANYIKAITAEAVLLAKSAGKTKLKNLEREDLRALTLEACAMTGIPLVGSDLVIGKGFGFSADNGL